MPILDLQKRARELGRIRIGHQVTGTSKTGKTYTRPEKLDRFRLTSASQALLEKVAALYGGNVTEWTPRGGTQQWEVLTDTRRIPILVPPQPVSQWLETWSAAGCVHRCDGVTNALTGDPCDPEDPQHKEARPTTRLNVVLRDVEGIGVWRLESHGWNAAIELPNAADFLSQAGGYIEGHLALEARTSKGENPRTGKIETRHFMVPIIEIGVTPSQLLAGEGAIKAPAVEGPVARTAIESGTRPDYEAMAAAASTPDELNAVWHAAKNAGHMTDALNTRIRSEAERIRSAAAAAAAPDPEPEPDEDGAFPAEVVEDEGAKNAAWSQVLAAAGDLGMSVWDVDADFQAFTGISPAQADVAAYQAYLTELQSRSTEAVAG